MRGQIPANNVAYGIRLRCKNIQVGDERTCRNFFLAEGDKRFSQYFYGELYVETLQLMPDARRDYLRECEYRSIFEGMVRDDFTVLKDLCNEASSIRGIIKKITVADKEKTEIEKKRESGSFLSQKEIDDDSEKYERLRKKKEKAILQLEKKKQETSQSNSPLCFIYDTISEQDSQPSIVQEPIGSTDGTSSNTPTTIQKEETPPTEETVQPKLRTDNIIYKKFGIKEKKIINAVYNAIYNAIADEAMREGLIKKIEKELTK